MQHLARNGTRRAAVVGEHCSLVIGDDTVHHHRQWQPFGGDKYRVIPGLLDACESELCRGYIGDKFQIFRRDIA